MELPPVQDIEDIAVNLVTTVVNAATTTTKKQTLFQLADSRKRLTTTAKLTLDDIVVPIPITAQKLLSEAIEETWKLTNTFKYYLEYKERTVDEVSDYHYYEAIFSQPTFAYPIPQVTVSVSFRVQQDHTQNHQTTTKVPSVTFRIEGHRKSHDVRYVSLTEDAILSVMKMKMKFFQRIEEEIIYF